MAQQIKDLALSLLWLGFYPWASNFCLLQVWPKKKKKKAEKGKVGNKVVKVNSYLTVGHECRFSLNIFCGWSIKFLTWQDKGISIQKSSRLVLKNGLNREQYCNTCNMLWIYLSISSTIFVANIVWRWYSWVARNLCIKIQTDEHFLLKALRE